MDKAYTNALLLRDKLRKELAEVEGFLTQWARFAGTDQDHNEMRGIVEIGEIGNESRSESRNSAARPQEIAKAAEQLIRKAGRPMTRSDVVEGLEAMGIRLGSSDKARYVGTILWRHKDLFINEGNGYTVADEAKTTSADDLLGSFDASSRKPDVFG